MKRTETIYTKVSAETNALAEKLIVKHTTKTKGKDNIKKETVLGLILEDVFDGDNFSTLYRRLCRRRHKETKKGETPEEENAN